MRSLIVDDDEICRKFLLKVMEKHGPCTTATTGTHAVEEVARSFACGELYDAIFLDIMMPEMDGRVALTAIRDMEANAGLTSGWGAKIIMTTALGDYDNVSHAFHSECDGYLVKPLKLSRMEALMRNLRLIPKAQNAGA